MRAVSVARTLAGALVALAAGALCVRLGFWQWQRWLESDAAWTRFTRATDTLKPLGARALAEVPLYQRVSLVGSLDGTHQFLLDNRSFRGRPGYEVLTPLNRDGAVTLLVDRGWVPFTGSRAHLPDVSLAATAPLTVSGRVAELPSAGLASGRAAPRAADPWPKVTSFPRPAELAASLGTPLEARILWLDPASPVGLARDWHPPGLTPLRHLAYAIQWWCFAALALALAALTGVRALRAARARR
jgi:surfeit locus 1 family protein